jgi:hypothetical protein
MPSIVETFARTGSAVGEASIVGVPVGRIFSTVAVGIAGEVFVGGGAAVEVITGVGVAVAVQAARKSKEATMSLFMQIIICHSSARNGEADFEPAEGRS